MKNALMIVGGIIVTVALIVGLWFGGWALTKANKAQEREVNHTSQQWTDAQVAAERNRVQGYDTSTNDAQRTQIAMTFCAVYDDLARTSNPPADLASAHARICN